MTLSVRERGEAVATLRWIHVRLMEAIASWVPTTPEMEAKLLFGAHIWDLAQHADMLGKRTYELRMPLQHSLEPCEAYVRFLEGFAGIAATTERLACFYEGVLPALAARYHAYLGQTDMLLDAPTVRVLEHLAREQARMIQESCALVEELPALADQDGARLEKLRTEERAIAEFVRPAAEETLAGEG